MERARTIVLVGAGGVGAPTAIALAAALEGTKGVTLRVVDDDRVELSNLHRQILFSEDALNTPKLDALAQGLRRRAPHLAVETRTGRALPTSVGALVAVASVVVDATDNFASRFLIADACGLAGVPVVHAAAVRWTATVMATAARGRPCYRCLFEDLPLGNAPDCATAGILGPVCGVSGAVAADRVMRILAGDASAYGSIVTFDGQRDVLRQVPVRARDNCPLCGTSPTIRDLQADRYRPAECELAL